MKQLILILALSLICLPAQNSINRQSPQSPELQQILNQVKKNNASLTPAYSQVLAQTILVQSKKHKIPAKLLAAILMQESAYKVSAKNIHCGVSVYSGKEDCIVIDFGIGQINHKTIKVFNFDKNKLLSDLAYSIEASAIVLADFRRMYGQKESDYWSRYNAGTRSKRQVYKTLVARYL